MTLEEYVDSHYAELIAVPMLLVETHNTGARHRVEQIIKHSDSYTFVCTSGVTAYKLAISKNNAGNSLADRLLVWHGTFSNPITLTTVWTKQTPGQQLFNEVAAMLEFTDDWSGLTDEQRAELERLAK